MVNLVGRTLLSSLWTWSLLSQWSHHYTHTQTQTNVCQIKMIIICLGCIQLCLYSFIESTVNDFFCGIQNIRESRHECVPTARQSSVSFWMMFISTLLGRTIYFLILVWLLASLLVGLYMWRNLKMKFHNFCCSLLPDDLLFSRHRMYTFLSWWVWWKKKEKKRGK